MCVSSSHSLFMLERDSPVSLPVLQSMLFDYSSASGLIEPAVSPPSSHFLFTVFNGGQSECPLCPSSLHFILSAEATVTTITFSSNFLFHCHPNYGFKSRTVIYETMRLDIV